ncbi:MAG TPA: alpha-glucan family phosphorylase [Chitinophagaceae bacterium]|nr:alpha-glucan family phosphorylase [Chitinophagaceae bacterium]
MDFSFNHPYNINPAYNKRVAYFCMEFAIHQPLKIYAGGLGFLAGSHMRSAYLLQQNIIGIGILWKYGYYDQVRKQDQTMDVLFEEKKYGFLQPTGIKFTIEVSRHQVWVTAFYLPPETFNTPPIFFLTTDLPENDYLAKTISHNLYDANPETKIAAAILLGAGGAKLLEMLHWEPEVYHLNESHGLPLAFYLHNRYKNLAEVKKRLVFTNHTPEEAGNQKTNIALLDKMSFFCGIPQAEVKAITETATDTLDHTLSAMRLANKTNAVSDIHRKTLNKLWSRYEAASNILSITNAQDFNYWHDEKFYAAANNNDDIELLGIKQRWKNELFDVVADQDGEIYDTKICTIVFAKRFTGYKRPDLLLHDMDRFHRLVSNKERPVQIIWAGKPYPMDYAGIGVFDKIVDVCKTYSNCSTLVGYELTLSKILKRGADIWLNVPRLTHEASGTSGMTAAMNGAVNVSLPDGWFPEFAKDKINSFVVPACDITQPDHIQDDADAASVYNLLENEVLPMYYDYPNHWLGIIKAGMQDIIPRFDAKRLAAEYYDKLYND